MEEGFTSKEYSSSRFTVKKKIETEETTQEIRGSQLVSSSTTPYSNGTRISYDLWGFGVLGSNT